MISLSSLLETSHRIPNLDYIHLIKVTQRICADVLSPFYDITRTPDKAEHEMTVAGSGNPAEGDLLEVARQTALDIEKCRKIIVRVREGLNNK